MKAKSVRGKTAEEIKTELEHSLTDGFTPSAAFVFISAQTEQEKVCSLLDEAGIRVFGATASGEFIDEEISRQAISVMLLELDPASFWIIFKETSVTGSKEAAVLVAEEASERISNPGFIIAIAGRSLDGTELIKGFQEKAGKNVTLFGGLAGNIDTEFGLLVFDSKQTTNNGFITFVIDLDKISMSGFATSGWKPIATFHTITKSEHNFIYTIDNEPAMDMMGKYLGLTFKETTDERIYSRDASPIQLYRDQAPSVLREITFFNTLNRGVSFAGPVPEGSKFRFSLPPDFDIIEKIKQDCDTIKEQQPEADALLIFSCASRLQSLGPMVGKEIEEIKKTWNCPTAGFFCFGEIGKYMGGETEFHNNTCSIVLLKEK